jgi:hypothetical protein
MRGGARDVVRLLVGRRLLKIIVSSQELRVLVYPAGMTASTRALRFVTDALRAHRSVGFTIDTASENAMTRGVTRSRAAGTDDTNHVFISAELEEAFEVLRTLAHEPVHVSDVCASGHRGTY